MAKPSKAAMRAAEELKCQEMFVDADDIFTKDIASLIDRETGLPELIQAVHNAIDDITTLLTVGKVISDESLDAWAEPYRNALRKAGEL